LSGLILTRFGGMAASDQMKRETNKTSNKSYSYRNLP